MNTQSQKKLITRVKRIRGQAAGIERMLEEKRYCIDILNQIAAVRSALGCLGNRTAHPSSGNLCDGAWQ